MFRLTITRRLALALAVLPANFAWSVEQSTAQPNDPPLFDELRPLHITISAPLYSIVRRAEVSTDEHEGNLILRPPEGSPREFSIKLSARGLSRRQREICRFPPLRVNFKKQQVSGSVFDGQDKLKLVTHCRGSDRYQNFTFQEYLIYRSYNAVTPMSFQVRLAEITYLDNEGRRDPLTRYGFFIEDIDHVARRNGFEELDLPKTRSSRLDPTNAAIYSLFQFMIGNLDWSAIRGPDPDDECCHNTKLIGVPADPEAAIYPVPYDFDYSGLISAPYASPPAGLRVRNVRQRLYRGFCRHNGEIAAAANLFLERRGAIENTFSTFELLDERERRDALDYIAEFFEIIGDPDEIDREIIRECRG